MRKRDKLKRAIELELREHKSSFVVYCLLRALVILCMIRQFFNQEYEHVFLCLLTLLLLIMPSLIQLHLRVEFPTTLEIIILLFIFSAEILGEINSYYLKYENWDTILHTINGFLMAAIGFSLVDIINREEKIKFYLSPGFMAITAFCFSMTVGVMWEFFEYGMDVFFGLDMQKDTIVQSFSSVVLDSTNSNIPILVDGIKEVTINGEKLGLGGYLDIGLHDTMFDLWVNFIGAVIFSIIGYFYIKNKGDGKFVKRFVPTLKDEDKDYLTMVENKGDTQS